MKMYKSLKLGQSIASLIALVVLIVTVGIPTMIHDGLSNIENSKNNYGVYTIEEALEKGIQEPLIDKIILQKDYYYQYFSEKFTNVEIEDTFYYIKSGSSGKFTMNIQNEGKPGITIYLQMDKNKTTYVSISIYLWHDGDFKETFAYINKDELEYIADYFEINNAYTLLQDNYKNLKQSDNNENSYFANYRDDTYEIRINEYKYKSNSTLEADYTISKSL